MKYAIRAIILLLVVATLIGAYFLYGDSLFSKFNVWQAHNAEKRGDVDLALLKYEKALGYTPKSPSIRLDMAVLYEQKGNNGRAEKVLYDGLVLQAGEPTMLEALAALYMKQDKPADAIALLDAQSGMANAIQARRPAALSPSPSPGRYNEELDILFDIPDGTTVYYTLDGSYPSIHGSRLEELIHLSAGETRLRAIPVNAAGLPGPLWEGEYSIDGIVAPVEFADSAMEALIRQTLGQSEGPLYSNDLWGIATLDNSDTEWVPTTLDDLQWLTGLVSLSLTGNDTAYDMTVLTTLSSLQELTLLNCRVDAVELACIGQLTGLRTLNLTYNRVATLAPLSELTRLTSLDISHNNVTDLSPLASLTALTTLAASENTIADISPLASLTALTTVHLNGNSITDLTPLTPLTALVTLHIADNAVTSVEALTAHDALESLYAGHNSITSVSPLAELASLKTLDISMNQITTLQPLLSCPALKTVDAFGNPLTDAQNAFDNAKFTVKRS